MISIALDAMGGDHGAQVVVPAALNILRKYPNLRVLLVGKESTIRPFLSGCKDKLLDRIEVVNATEVVEMDESPSQALRGKKDSSMRVAIDLVKEGSAQACVSAGNTGALMATARFVLKTIQNIDRPAILSEFPTMIEGHHVRMLDLGANVDSDAQYLFQFGVMGSVLASAVENIPNPKVALLNIGEEEIKGNIQVKNAAELFSNSDIVNYIGYIEADDIFAGEVDVVVCDGFVGNIALKASEGSARLIFHYIKEAFKKNWITRMLAMAAIPILKIVASKIDPAKYNGASFIGLQGTVIKSHGGASQEAFETAIIEAMKQVEKDVPSRIKTQVSYLLEKKEIA